MSIITIEANFPNQLEPLNRQLSVDFGIKPDTIMGTIWAYLRDGLSLNVDDEKAFIEAFGQLWGRSSLFSKYDEMEFRSSNLPNPISCAIRVRV